MSPSATLLPQPSAITSRLKADPPSPATSHEPHHHHLALQILHNLQHQHDWTSLRIHTHSSTSTSSPQKPSSSSIPDAKPISPVLLPRPLISGLPPQRIYVHPDEQVEMLKRGVEEERVEVEREWVLPTHLREKWSLRRMAEVFDAVGVEPGGVEPEGVDGDKGRDGDGDERVRGGEGGEEKGEGMLEKNGIRRRRGGKRMVLATLGDDSTVVFYIVHEGLVKPRQN